MVAMHKGGGGGIPFRWGGAGMAMAATCAGGGGSIDTGGGHEVEHGLCLLRRWTGGAAEMARVGAW